MTLSAVRMRSPITSLIAIEQLLQKGSTQLMHRRPNRYFAGFQIQMAKPLAVSGHAPNQAVDFRFRLAAKRLRSFFFNCSNSSSSARIRAGRS